MSVDTTEPMHTLGVPPPRLVGFDLDGTLVDSVPDIAWCIDRTMPRPPRGEALVRLWVGNGVQRLVERALTGEPDTPADPGLHREACSAFLDLYSTQGRDRSRVYPGVHEGLAALCAHGTAFACITNKPHAPGVDLLVNLKLLGSFALVLGGDSLPRCKPDPLPSRRPRDDRHPPRLRAPPDRGRVPPRAPRGCTRTGSPRTATPGCTGRTSSTECGRRGSSRSRSSCFRAPRMVSSPPIV